jgi:hypothetical protein
MKEFVYYILYFFFFLKTLFTYYRCYAGLTTIGIACTQYIEKKATKKRILLT